MNIEELMKKAYRDEAQTPPEDAWNEIAHRVSEHAPTPSRRKWVWAAAAFAVTGAVALGVVLRHNTHNPTQTAVMPLTETPTATATSAPEAARAVPSANVAPTIAQMATAEQPAPTAKPEAAAAPTPIEPVAEPPAEPVVDMGTATVADNRQLEKASPTHREVTEQTATPTPTQPETEAEDETLLRIPNYVSANGDGINDCWAIPDIEQFAQVQVRIYTARGKCIYSNDHYENQFCGDRQPAGNYFYVIVAKTDKGSITRRGVLIIKK